MKQLLKDSAADSLSAEAETMISVVVAGFHYHNAGINRHHINPS